MRIYSFLVTIGAFLSVLALTWAASAFTYKCPRCGLVQTYDRAGMYKCPNDGMYLVPQP